jgi:hypothetical protein
MAIAPYFLLFCFLVVVSSQRIKFDEEQQKQEQEQLKCFILPLALGSFKSLLRNGRWL